MDRSEINDLGIVIPALNEEKSIAKVVKQVVAHGRVIVVDDGSTDDTGKVATGAGAIVVRHPQNRGYDAAMSSGFAKASELGCKFVITMDGDGQHDSSLIKTFREQMEKQDLVLGVRPAKARLAEKLFAAYTQLRFGVKDPLCGMKGYRMELYQELGHFDSYGSIGTELSLYALHRKRPFVQIPVPIRDRDGKPRFGRTLKSNYLIMRALVRGFTRVGV